MIFDPIINTCLITTETSRQIAYYSHLVPVFFTIFLSLLVFFKAPRSILSKVFLAFSVAFSFWLIADLVTWVSNDYFLVYSFWAPVDFIESVMFVLGLYFALTYSNKSDISMTKKLLLFAVTLIPFFITFTGKSVLGFYHPVCEAVNDGFLLDYRFYLEILAVGIIFIYMVAPFFKKSIRPERKSRLMVLGSIFLFLTTFGVTSYLSASTGYYELNLYALFIIPLFLIGITYSIFNLDIFNIKLISTYLIVFGFIILSASQLIFITNTTSKLLTILTVLMSIILASVLFRNLKRESDQRVRIEKLSVELNESKMHLEETNDKLETANEKLKGLDKLKTEFVSLASHQLRSPLTAIKGYTSMLLEGDYGDIDPKAKETIERVMESSNNLTMVVEDLLNVSKIESGGMKYEMAPFNLTEMASDEAKDLSMTAEKKGLKLEFKSDKDLVCMVNGDKEKIRQVMINFIDNSIKYTKEGNIDVSVFNVGDKVRFEVKDTGMGMTPEIKKTLFHRFARGDGQRMNTTGTGLGLYLAKQIVEAHKGIVGVDSDGIGKGSTFYMELDAVKF